MAEGTEELKTIEDEKGEVNAKRQQSGQYPEGLTPSLRSN